MELGSLIFTIVELLSFLYMLGIGFQLVPDFGLAGSQEEPNKNRLIFKVSGAAGVLYVLATILTSLQ